jgi:hypothetical protein
VKCGLFMRNRQNCTIDNSHFTKQFTTLELTMHW